MILNDLKIMERLLRRGVLFQITASSIISSSAKIQKIVLKMISKGYVHVVASDAHDPVYRPPILSEAYARIKEIFNEKEARRLFIENPNRIIQSKDIE
jgi:protein-tyrosine phosphatase